MKFHFENLGLLDEADIELGDLTIICGENNTGKTYATYAIYGFLSNWREILRFHIFKKIEDIYKTTSNYDIDLNYMFQGNISNYVEMMCQSHVKKLPRIFASNSNIFNKIKFGLDINNEYDFSSISYQHTVKSGPDDNILATIKKVSGSFRLEVLIVENESINQDHSYTSLFLFIADAIIDIVFSTHFPIVYISSAERSGITIFRNELDFARSQMRKYFFELRSKDGSMELLRRLRCIDSNYALPIEHNVEFDRERVHINNKKSELTKDNSDLLKAFDAIIGGTYLVENGKLFFQNKDIKQQRFTMNESSSCIRALLDVGFYLRCHAKAGDLFMIDEPELNLHPKNQRAFARLVARMINAGIKVFMTTHSDYLVKEINTLIMLNQKSEHTKEIQKKFEYEDSELIDHQRVRLYMTGTTKSKSGSGRSAKIRTLIPAKIARDIGIEVNTFDETINLMNNIQNEILYGGDM